MMIYHHERIQSMFNFAHTLDCFGQFILYLKKEHEKVLWQLSDQACKKIARNEDDSLSGSGLGRLTQSTIDCAKEH